MRAKSGSGQLVILSGPVAAGKTTVAKELVKLATKPTAYIEGDEFWKFIAKPPPNTPRQMMFRTIVRSMFAASMPFVNDGYEAILDFTVPPFMLEAVRARLKGQPFDYVVIKPSIETCVSRAASRPEGTITDYTEYREFYDLFAGYEEYTINNDDTDPASLAAIIRKDLNEDFFRIK